MKPVFSLLSATVLASVFAAPSFAQTADHASGTAVTALVVMTPSGPATCATWLRDAHLGSIP